MRLLGDEKVVVRFTSLYIIGLILFFLSWTLSYFFLPEGIFRGIGILGGLAGGTAADLLFTEFLKIFGLNLVGYLLILLGNYILRVRSFSYGHLVPLA